MRLPSTELRPVPQEIGNAVFASRVLPKGTLNWVMCALEQVYDVANCAGMPAPYRPHLERYTDFVHAGDRVLSCDIGHLPRLSCDPNAPPLPGRELKLAVGGMELSDQLMDAYGTLDLNENPICPCGNSRNRGVITRSDQACLQSILNNRVRMGLAHTRLVEQPLNKFMLDVEGELAPIAAGLVDPM